MLRINNYLYPCAIFLGLYLLTPVSADTTSNQTKPLWNSTWSDVLKRDLLVNYDKFVRPADHDSTTQVNVSLTVKHIDLDEEKGIMSVFGWIKMQWNDNKLIWNTSQYGNLQNLHLPDHEIWQPDLTLYNSAIGNAIDHYGNTMCIVSNTGYVIWVPPFQFQVFCELDLRYWPFDTQTCKVVLGSWVYNGLEIALDSSKYGGAEVDTFVENHEWSIKNITTTTRSVKYPCCVEHYVSNEYDIVVERRSPVYKTVVITPATCIIIMTLTCFWLPPQCGEKIILNGFNIIVISLFMMYFAQKLPIMAIHTPLVVLFYSSSLYLVCISMIVSVIVIYLSKAKHMRKVPWFIKNLLDGWLGRILGVCHLSGQKSQTPARDEELRDQPFEDHSTADDSQMINNTTKISIQQDWIILATAIDRVFFLIYCFVFIILAACYSV